MRTTEVKFTHDGIAVGHLEIDGVDVSHKTAGNGLTFQTRGGQPPLLTVGVHLPAFDFTGSAEVQLDEASEALIRAAGWVKAEEVPSTNVVNHYGDIVAHADAAGSAL